MLDFTSGGDSTAQGLGCTPPVHNNKLQWIPCLIPCFDNQSKHKSRKNNLKKRKTSNSNMDDGTEKLKNRTEKYF